MEVCDEKILNWYEKKEAPQRLDYVRRRDESAQHSEDFAKSFAQHLIKQVQESAFQAILRVWSTEWVVVESATDTQLEQKFREQVDKWDRETRHLSSPTQIRAHPSYQAILGMDRDKVVPLLLRDMQQNGRAWFGALSYLTGENPIEAKDAGKMDKMIAAWVKWGQKRNIL